MKTTVLYLTVLGCACAIPSGNYHQEYNYKTSSSSYRNNELQHQTDDQGYYKKDGDLEGRVRPKVDANSEHSEYINPNLRNSDYRSGLIGAPNGDLSSYGHMRANVGSYNTNDQSEGLAHSDHISGSRSGYSGYSSGAYGASYGSGSQSYSVASNLGTMTSRVQQELEEDLQRAIQENRAYSQNNQLEFSELERELRNNLTSKLNDEIAHRYGQQSIRGGLSYTISGGRLHSTANYDNQELLDLRRSMENTLLNQLRSRYNQVSSANRYIYSTTTLRPAYYTHYPSTSYRPIAYTTVRPQYIDNSNYNTRYNAESITTIASRVQNQLDARLNQILDDVQRTHFSSSSSYSLTNTDVLLERLRNELRANVTYLLEEEIRRSFGTQIQRDGHMYAAGSETSGQSNYSVSDLENLRAQIERNLIEKLNRDFARYQTSWNQRYKQSSYNSQSSYGEFSTTPRYAIYTTPHTSRYEYTTPVPQYNLYDGDVEPLSNRPSSNHLTSLITGTKGGSMQSNHYLLSGSGQSAYGVSGQSRDMSQLQRQLQQDLSRQLQSALSRGQYGYYTSSGSYNPQSYQASLQQLTEELNRNLTRQLQEYSSGSYYSTYGNFDQAQLASLRNQLQADLTRQLQQGLQQSYHSSSSYSASSSSSSSGNYRPTRGFENYQMGQYRHGGNIALMQGEDCVGDDPNAYTNHRTKRSYQPYRSQPIGLNYNYNSNRNYNSYRNKPQEPVELGQEIDNTDLTQQVEDPGYGKLQAGSQVDLGQQVEESDLTQQVESADLQGQQTVDSDEDLTQQVVDDGFGKLQLGSQQSQRPTGYDRGQQVDNDDLTQQIQDDKFGKLQIGSQQSQRQTGNGQQIDDSDLTQQVESEDLQAGSQIQQQTEDNDDLTQQIQDNGFGKLHLGSQQSQRQTRYDDAQHVDDSDLTQQVESADLQSGSQTRQERQEVDNDDLTQQTEDDGFGKLQIGSQHGQQQIEHGQEEDNSDLTQQVEDSDFGRLQSGSQQKPQHISSSSRYPQRPQSGIYQDLNQQQEDETDYGNLQIGSQTQQTSRGDQEITDSQELKVTQQIKEELTKQLKYAVQENAYIIRYSGSDDVQMERIYQNLNNELRRNITKQLRVITSSNFYHFNSKQLSKLQKKLENDLRLELTEELTSISKKKPDVDDTQQVDDSHLTQQTEEDAFGQRQGPANPSNLNSLGIPQLVLTNNQMQFLEKIEKKLSEQVTDAVRTKYSQSYRGFSSNTQVVYRELLNELKSNITNELHRISTGLVSDRQSYITYYTFTDQQLVMLKQKIESDLKLQLEQDVFYSSYNNQYTGHQQQLGQESVGADLTQQVEDSDLTQQSVSSQFEDQNFGQQPVPLNNVLDQHSTDNIASETQDLNKPQNPQFHQDTSGNSQLNQDQLDLNHLVDNNYQTPLQIPSANLLSNRPVTKKPIDSNQFINTEINQQQEYPLGGGPQIYQNPHNLPTLNQVIQNNQVQYTEPPSKVEPLGDDYEDLTQQVDNNQQIGTDLTNSGRQNPNMVTGNINEPQPQTPQSQGGQAIGVTSQGQLFTHTQSLSDAERDADILIQRLREHNRNNPRQSNIYRQPVYPTGTITPPISPSQELIPPNQQQQTFYGADFNQQQTSLVDDLKYTLSKDLESAVVEYYRTSQYSSANQFTPQSYQVSYQQLSQDLQKNITDKLQQLADGASSNLYGLQYHIYNTLTQDQRVKLHNKLQTELTRHLEQTLQASYDLQQTTIQDSRRYPSANPYGQGQYQIYRPYGERVGYGQPGQVEQNFETASDLKPLDYQQASIVQGVEPQVRPNNIGVKGRRYQPHNVPSSPSQPLSVPPPAPPQEQGLIPLEPVPPQPEEIPQIPTETVNATDENLPWWKRFGHKVKQGAQKLIG